MKKIFVVLTLAAALLVAGCKPQPVSVLKQAKADYAAVVEEAPEGAQVAFYEIEMVLDNPVSALNEGKDIKLQSARTVIQQDSLVKFIDRFYNDKGKVTDTELIEETGFWVGDLNMPLDSLVLDLQDAINKLKETDTILPEGDKVTLRAPLAPPFRTYYIFGTYGTFFIAVDAITGEVSDFTLPEDLEEGIEEE